MRKLIFCLLCWLPMIPILAQTNLSNGLVAYYPFNNNANDESGKGNNGTLNKVTATTDRSGKTNAAYQINAGGSIKVANSASLKFTNALSYSVWVMPVSTAGVDGNGANSAYGYHVIFSKNCDRANFYTGIGYNSQTVMNFSASTWYGGHSVDKISFKLNEWMHLAASYDGTQMKLYVNGKLVGSKATKIDFSASNNANLVIGAMNCWPYYFNGKIDELRLYNRALIDAEVQELYQPASVIPSLTLSTAIFSAPARAGQSTVSITSNTAWTVSTNATWLVPKSTSGTGNQSLVFNYQANTATTARTAKLTFKAGTLTKELSVTQTGAVAPTLTLSTAIFSAPASAGQSTVSVTSNTAWTVSSNVNWLVPKSTTGTGNQNLTFDYQANTATTARTAKLTFKAGALTKELSVTQTAAVIQNTLSVTPVSLSFTAASEGKQISINSNTNWTITQKPSWLTLSVESGSNNATITATVANNSNYDARYGDLIITAGTLRQTIKLDQAAYKAVLAVLPVQVQADNVDEIKRFIDMFTTSDWTISTDAAWLKVATMSGQAGNQHIAFTIEANTTLLARTGTIYVSAANVQQKITVSQKASSPPVVATCGQPQNLKLSIEGDFVKATWLPVNGASRYKVWYSENSESYVQRSSPTSTEYNGYYSKPSANACIRIEAQCTNGLTSESSTEVCIKTSPPSKCMTPPNLRYTILNNNTARFEWDAVPNRLSYSLSINDGLQMITTTDTYKDFPYQLGQTLCAKISSNCPDVYTGWSKEVCAGNSSVKFAASTSQINALAKGGSPNVFVFSTAQWEIANATGGFFSTQIAMTPQNNPQDGKITINVNENFGTTTRTGSFAIRQKGVTSPQIITVNISQAGQYVAPPPPPTPVCDAPTSLGHTLMSNDYTTVSWLPVEGVSSYQVYAKFENTDWAFLENAFNSYVVKSITPNTNACFKVLTVCANAGRSAESVEYCFDSRLLVYPNTQNVDNNADSFDVSLDATEKWTASTDASWLSVSPNSGNAGKGQKLKVSYTAYRNANGRIDATGERLANVFIKMAKSTTTAKIIQSATDLLSNVPSNILSPVVGEIAKNKWSFNQHKTDGHSVTGGIGGCDDTYAWDINYNTTNPIADNGLPVYAVATGRVVGINSWGGISRNQILIEHTNNGRTWYSGYLHMNNLAVKVGDIITNTDKKIGEISNISPKKIDPHLHFAVYYLNSSNKLISVDRQITQRTNLSASKIEPVNNLLISPNPLVTGKMGAISTTLKNTGNKDFTGQLVVAIHETNGTYITDLPDKFIGVLGIGQIATIGKSSSVINSFAGTYKLLTKKFENNSWTTLETKTIEILPSSDFTKQPTSNFKGVSLYTDTNNNNIFVLDLREGANLGFHTGMGKIISPNTNPTLFKRETIEAAFSQSRLNNSRTMAVFNGQYFGEEGINLTESEVLKYPVYIGGKILGEQLDDYEATIPYVEIKTLSVTGSLAQILPAYKILEKGGKKYFSKETLNIQNGITGFDINNGSAKWYQIRKIMSNLISNKTVMAGINTDSDIKNFEKIAIYIGGKTREDIITVMQKFGVRISKIGDYYDADIIELDGSGSTQCYGYDNYKNSKLYFESSDKGKNEWNSCEYDTDFCYNSLCRCAARKIPQWIAIMADYNNPNARQSATDNNLVAVDEMEVESETNALTIYPNPNKDGLVGVSYQIPAEMQGQEVSIAVFDVSGNFRKHVKLGNEPKGQTLLDLSNQTTGHYKIVLQAGSFNESKTLVLER